MKVMGKMQQYSYVEVDSRCCQSEGRYSSGTRKGGNRRNVVESVYYEKNMMIDADITTEFETSYYGECFS